MNCVKCKAWMSEAATDGLSERRRAEFDAHVQSCAGCRAEFERTKALVLAIDGSVVGSVAGEPSPDFIARVRRWIATQTMSGKTTWPWAVPAIACAAAIILAVSFGQFWPRGNQPRSVQTPASGDSSLAAATHTEPSPPITLEHAGIRGGKAHDGAIREVAARKSQRVEREPEVLVPPGQGEALLQFAAAIRSGKIDGVKLMADLKAAGQPIEIKPLVIAPLELSTEDENKDSGPGSIRTQKDFVSGMPIQSLEP
ncbi:MAG TPA: zf-HC2 domain-containing protein [Candidatus Acidoferrales bacterium]|nr:zf-HC2 domain-containing protein [Candidatus Acidoferrales bacterium]